VESVGTPFTRALRRGQVLAMPISHGEGKYHADAATLERLRQRGQIVFRYATAAGQVVAEANPNGSLDNIAGIASADGRVLGLMPHPERAAETAMGGTDGLLLFQSLLGAAAEDGVFAQR
jgi:phosphoribosylformylglycinamidine synthase